MDLLDKTLGQLAFIFLAANAAVFCADRFGWQFGWWIADILLIAAGVVSLRVFQEIAALAAKSGTPSSPAT
jgi:hypothetical protein